MPPNDPAWKSAEQAFATAVGMFVVMVPKFTPFKVYVTEVPAAFTEITSLCHTFAVAATEVVVEVRVPPAAVFMSQFAATEELYSR